MNDVVRQGVPTTVPSSVRAYSGVLFCWLFCKCLSHRSLWGARGSRRTLLDPLPLGLSVAAARKLAGHRRSYRLAKPQGQGLSPLHPSDPARQPPLVSLFAGAKSSCPPCLLWVYVFLFFERINEFIHAATFSERRRSFLRGGESSFFPNVESSRSRPIWTGQHFCFFPPNCYGKHH